MSQHSLPLVVHKFGGTSVGGAARIRSVASLLDAASAGQRVVAVVSAMSTVTNRLLAACDRAASGGAFEDAIDALESDHETAIAGLELGPDDSAATRAAVKQQLDALRTVLRAVAGIRELTPRVKDFVAVFGEKMSARMVAAALRARALKAVHVDADTFLETDGEFGSASPLGEAADRGIRRTLGALLAEGTIPVVTGFCGRSPDGSTTTLGRGGSDFSATILGGGLEADRVVIWTDVDGVYTADPRAVPEARLVEQLHYREAAELAFYGAKVLHPRTLQPVASRGIPVEVRNSFRPDARFTVVDGRLTPGSHPVKAISAIPGHALVAVEGRGMAGVPGVAARLFGALAQRSISVTAISQSSAESSICVAIPAAEAAAAEVALKREFRLDLSHGDIEEITVRPRVGLVAAVGIGMAHAPGVSGRVFTALGRHGVNVLAIAQGSSELNITLAVDEAEIPAALGAIHREFGLHRRDTGVPTDDGFDVVVHGFGNIGRRVADLLIERRESIRARFGLVPRLVAITDSSGAVFSARGLTAEQVATAAATKREQRSLASLSGTLPISTPEAFAEKLLGWRFARPIVVDTTADPQSGALFEVCLRAGADLVTANKWPMAAPSEAWERLRRTAVESGRLIRGEATVGAGLPIIDTFEMLVATGDQVHSVEGCLSGTLGFVLSELNEGRPFKEAVLEAWDRGYTEPDPVLDLLGTDVLRKAIILRRVAGLADAGEVEARCEPLVDATLLGAGRAQLERALGEYDARYAARAAEAAAAGQVLRYVARVDRQSIRVGMEAVDRDSALGRLGRGDNMVVVHSERYAARPLTITGPGAGTDVTAMGVLADVLRIVAERGPGVR